VAASGRQKSEGRAERCRKGVLQRESESRGKTGVKTPRAQPENRRRCQKAQIFLREDVWDESQTYERKNRERPKLADQQIAPGVELLT
jgi:hypothetical protein